MQQDPAPLIEVKEFISGQVLVKAVELEDPSVKTLSIDMGLMVCILRIFSRTFSLKSVGNAKYASFMLVSPEWEIIVGLGHRQGIAPR